MYSFFSANFSYFFNFNFSYLPKLFIMDSLIKFIIFKNLNLAVANYIRPGLIGQILILLIIS